MNSYDFYQFMNRPLVIYSKIEHQSEVVQRLELICMNATASVGEKVQTSRHNTQEKRYDALADATQALDQLTNELMAACDEIREFLYENLSFEDADVLEWKYINCKSINEISKKIHNTYSGTATKISRAEKNAKKAYYSINE